MIGIIIFGVLIAFLLAVSQITKVYKYKIEFEKLPQSFDGFKIVHISDWHDRKFGFRIVNMIRRLNADVMLVTGDSILRGTRGIETFLNLVKKLDKKCAVYYVVGNHELGFEKRWDDNYFLESYYSKLQTIGVKVLDNDKATIRKGDEEIVIYGLTLPLKYYKKIKKSEPPSQNELVELLGKPDKDKLNILLIHSPEYFQSYAKWGADLCFAGHNHGGIAYIPFIGGVISSSMELFPKYDAGLFEEYNSKMVLSRGAGNNGVKIRFLNNPEIGFVKLKQTK